MAISIRAIVSNNLLHKSSALILGFLLWSQLTMLHQHTVTMTVPLCFYGAETSAFSLEAPETVTITLRGKKRDLATLDRTLLAAHIDASRLKEENNGLILSNKDLFLPDSISLVYYYPLPLMVVKKHKKE